MSSRSTPPIPLMHSEIIFGWLTDTFLFTHLETLSTEQTLLNLIPMVTMQLSFHLRRGLLRQFCHGNTCSFFWYTKRAVFYKIWFRCHYCPKMTCFLYSLFSIIPDILFTIEIPRGSFRCSSLLLYNSKL